MYSLPASSRMHRVISSSRLLPGQETGPAAEPEGKAKKEKKSTPKSGNALQKELEKIAQRAYSEKQQDTYHPVVSSPEITKKLKGRECVMHKEAWDEEESVRVERAYYDYNTVLELTSNGKEQLYEFETAKEAVDYYFK